MRKSRSKRPKSKIQLPENSTVEEFERAWFEILEHPEAAKSFKTLAAALGISLEVMMYETIADVYQLQRKPVPPQIREYIGEHAPQRVHLLKSGLN